MGAETLKTALQIYWGEF